MHSAGIGVPTVSVGRSMGSSTGGRSGSGSSGHIFSLGCEGSSGEGVGVFVGGGGLGEKRDGVKASGPLAWTGSGFYALGCGESLGV